MSVRAREENTQIVSRRLFLLFAGVVLLLDQLTKLWAQSALASARSLPVLPQVFHLTLVENRGIAFGFFQGSEKLLFIAITLSIAALTAVGLSSRPFRFKTQMGIGLILGGALGNWVDRIRFGAVIDFLDFRVWPVFNLADTAITAGVGLFLLDFLRKRNVS